MSPDKEHALQELVDALGKGDEGRIQELLNQLEIKSHSNVYERIGTMARELHRTLLEFNQSMSSENVTMHSTTLPDAVDKLEEVLKVTFQAADKTLNSVEEQNTILSSSYEALGEALETLKPDNIPDETVRTTLKEMLEAERERVERSLAINNEIMMTQEFQDLTGQALKKVIKLVQGMKDNISALIEIFGAEDLPPVQVAQESEQALDENKLDQGDVDSVLKDCGF